ncbi:MAG: leucine-rich repeat domain-containing protein [Armatimonadetes bacterium]|nr:leucine-rich repeat domain-containing protein [Armatimonadota bacterium]
MAQTSFSQDGWSYEVKWGDELVLTERTGPGFGELTIPETVVKDGKTYRVTLGRAVLKGCAGPISLTLPDSLDAIGEYAFGGCTSLSSVTIPDSVREIRGSAFEGCTGLASIVIPPSVVDIGGGAFKGCTSLTSIDIPDSVNCIGPWAFEECSGLTAVTLPNSLVSIGSGAFRGCASLRSVTVRAPGPVLSRPAKQRDLDTWRLLHLLDASIGMDAFAGCISLEEIEIPRSIGGIDSCAFKGCTSLRSIVIPDAVTQVGAEAFMGCTALTSIEIPQSVMSGRSYGVFEGCTGLTAVTFADSVTEIGNSVLKGCTGLRSVEIPSTVVSIGDAFEGCTSLKYVEIPDSVSEIGPRTFKDCSGLTALVVLPKSLTAIKEGAFEGCVGLTSITIPEGVVSIDKRAFKGCIGLTSLTIPDSVASIAASAFEGCSGLPQRTKRGVLEGVDPSRVDNSEQFVHAIWRMDFDLDTLFGIDESSPAFWSNVLAALVNVYFKERDRRDIDWLKRWDWPKILGLCVEKAQVPIALKFDYMKSMSGGTHSYLPGRRADSTWLEHDRRVIELLYESGATCESFSDQKRSRRCEYEVCGTESDCDARAMMTYGQADAVKEVFRREGFDATKVEIDEFWMLGRMAKSDNGSALRWVFEMHPEMVGRVKDSISKLFDEGCYDAALALIEQRDSFKTPSAEKYFAHFAGRNDIDAVATLMAKGTLKASNAVRVDGALDGIKTEAADAVRCRIAELRGSSSGAGEAKASSPRKFLAADEVRRLNDQLRKAVQSRDGAAVAALIAAGAEPAQIEDIVALAVELEDIAMVAALLAAKAVPSPEALLGAALRDDLPMVELLMAAKASITKRAVTEHDEPRSQSAFALLGRDKKVKKVPVLEAAIGAKSFKAVQAMLASGQKIPPKVAEAALRAAVETGDIRMVEMISSGIGEFESMSMALKRAIERALPAIAVLLKSKGASFDGGEEDVYDGFYRTPRRPGLKGASPTQKRRAVMLALNENGLLTEAEKAALLCRALLWDKPLFVAQLVDWGVRPLDEFRRTSEFRGGVYRRYSDYLRPDMSAETAKLICEHLDPGETVPIPASFLAPPAVYQGPPQDGPPVEFLAQIVPYSDAQHCEDPVGLLRIMAKADRVDALSAMEGWGAFTSMDIDEAIAIAGGANASAATAYLLDCRKRLFGTSGQELTL